MRCGMRERVNPLFLFLLFFKSKAIILITYPHVVYEMLMFVTSSFEYIF